MPRQQATKEEWDKAIADTADRIVNADRVRHNRLVDDVAEAVITKLIERGVIQVTDEYVDEDVHKDR